MNTQSYYEDLKQLARQVRAENGLSSPRVLPNDLMRIYAKYEITVDEWPYRFRNLRGAFINDHLGATVMVAKGLPQDPMAFTMAHELKHFFRDRDLGISYCDQSNLNKSIEIGAEIFAAELLFPDRDFVAHMNKMGIRTNQCLPKNLDSTKTTDRNDSQLRRSRHQSGTTRLCSVSFLNDDQDVAQTRSTVQPAAGKKRW